MGVFVITLAFSNAEILKKSLHSFYQLKCPGLKIDRHVVVDQHYPINYKAQVVPGLRSAAEKYGVEIIDPGKNLGLHHGINWALGVLKPQRDDIVIGFDPDSMPISPGWDMALVRAIAGSSDVVWSTLANPRTISDIKARGYTARMVDGHLPIWITHTAITNSVCAWRYGWLEDVGFLTEPRAFYGHLETAMFQKLGSKKWAVVPGFEEVDDLRYLHDRSYIVYKWAHAHTNQWGGDFQSFLDAGCPGFEDEDLAPQQLP